MPIIDINDDRGRSLDVMQHIRRIYKLLGVDANGNKEDGTPLDTTLVDAINTVVQSNQKIYVGPKAEYEEMYGSGILNDVVCFITDDYVDE